MDNRDELRDELNGYLNGLRIMDDITRDEQNDILEDFDAWCETASVGDTYWYDSIGNGIKLRPKSRITLKVERPIS